MTDGWTEQKQRAWQKGTQQDLSAAPARPGAWRRVVPTDVAHGPYSNSCPSVRPASRRAAHGPATSRPAPSAWFRKLTCSAFSSPSCSTLSTRAIASIVGVDQKTVRRDLASEANASVERPAKVMSLDGLVRQSLSSSQEVIPHPMPRCRSSRTRS